MKKKLESELISIANRILKLKGKEDVLKMYEEVSALHEKLSVLKFAHENFESSITSDASFFGMLDKAFNNTVSDNIEIEDKIYVNLDEIEDDGIIEPVMEKIKDMVAQMPQETQQVDNIMASMSVKEEPNSNDFESITANFKNTPIFEPIQDSKIKQKKSLNDKLKNEAFAIGLNDKLAFVKHLFNNSTEDYERVLSQLNTASSYTEASNLIQEIVKPDYNHWINKDEYEDRFMEIIERKFA